MAVKTAVRTVAPKVDAMAAWLAGPTADLSVASTDAYLAGQTAVLKAAH